MMLTNTRRNAALAALLFVAALTLTLTLGGDGTPEKQAAFEKYIGSDKSEREGMAIYFGLLFTALGALWLSASVRRLHDLAGSDGILARLAQPAAGAFGGMACVIAGLNFAIREPSGAKEMRTLDPATASVIDGATWFGLTGALALLALLTFAIAHLGRHGVIPRWLGTVGYVVAVLQFASMTFFPVMLAGLWLLVVAVFLLLPARDEAGREATA